MRDAVTVEVVVSIHRSGEVSHRLEVLVCWSVKEGLSSVLVPQAHLLTYTNEVEAE